MTPLRGTYRYAVDGKRQAIDEPFEITRDGDGFVLSGQRIVGNQVVLEVRACFTAGACQKLDLAWNMENRLVTHYRLDGDAIEWSMGRGATKRESLPTGCLLFPLLRAATGFLFPGLLDTPRHVVVPNIRNPNDEDFLVPLVSLRHVTNHDPNDASHYRYYGGEYGDLGADYWLGGDGLITRYRWASGTALWEVTLEKE